MLAVLKILFGCGFTVAVSFAIGRWFLIATGAWNRFDAWEKRVFAFGIGAAWLSNLVFALAATHLLYTWTLAALGCLSLWFGLRRTAGPAAAAPDKSGLVLGWTAPILAAFGCIYLIHALAPETSPDGASYHLGLVLRYIRNHGFGQITTNMYAMISQGMEMLFLFAFSFGRHSAAKMTHFAFLVATVPAILCFGRRFRLGPAAAVAAVLYACSPVVGTDGTCSYNDCALAFFTFLAFYLLLIWEETRAPELWPAIGVAAGFCFSIKYTGFLVLPFALGFLLWRARPGWWAPARTFTLYGSLFVLPWLVKNALIVGNPFAPFFNRWFPNPYIHVSFEQMYAFMMRHYSGIAERNWSDYWSIPWELTVAGAKLQGVLGPVFLCAPLALIALRRPLGRRIWAAALIFALPWLGNIGSRFLIPTLLFVSLAFAVAIGGLPRNAARVASVLLVCVHSLLSWPAFLDRWNSHHPWSLAGPLPWKAALRIEKEPDYLARVAPNYNVARMIEGAVPPGKRVFNTDGVMEAYTSREILVSFQCALCEVIMDTLLTPALPDAGPVWSIQFDWDAVPLTGVRVVQTNSDPMEMWSIHELLLYNGGNYISPLPAWSIQASPNPWDGAMALDGNPATRWRTWHPIYPGMKFEVNFPESLTLSSLELACSADQNTAAFKVEGKDPSGRWSDLPARMRRADRPVPHNEIRTLATAEVKRLGVDYILLDVRGEGMNLIAPPIARNPAAWGLKQVAAYGPVRLYQIQ